MSGDAIRPLSEVVAGLSEIVRPLGSPAEGERMRVEAMHVALPLEVRVEAAAGEAVRVTAAAPERTATSFTPALAELRLHVHRDDET